MDNVWLKFESFEDEEAVAEANIIEEAGGYVVAWSLTSVGLVKRVWFYGHDEAVAWLEKEGFQDCSS